MFRPGNRGKSFLGKRLHRQQESEEPEGRGSLTCETSAESSYAKFAPAKSMKAEFTAELQPGNELLEHQIENSKSEQ
jgi:hypothetical protein